MFYKIFSYALINLKDFITKKVYLEKWRYRIETMGVYLLDDSEKINLLHKIAKNRGWILPDKVSKFILNHFDRDLYFLCNVIKSIDERSLSEKKNITIPFIKKIIKSRQWLIINFSLDPQIFSHRPNRYLVHLYLTRFFR